MKSGDSLKARARLGAEKVISRVRDKKIGASIGGGDIVAWHTIPSLAREPK